MLANNRADSWPAKPQSFIHLLSLLFFKIPSDQRNIKLHVGNVLVFEIDLETDGNGVATSSHAPPHRLDHCMRFRVASVGMFECSYMWLHYKYITYKSFSIVVDSNSILHFVKPPIGCQTLSLPCDIDMIPGSLFESCMKDDEGLSNWLWCPESSASDSWDAPRPWSSGDYGCSVSSQIFQDGCLRTQIGFHVAARSSSCCYRRYLLLQRYQLLKLT